MSLWNTVELTHVALRLVSEILDPIDMRPVVRKEFRVIDAEVMEV